MRPHLRQFDQQIGAVLWPFAHAENAAAAQPHARFATQRQRIEPILIGPRTDDGRIIVRPGVQVVIVIVEAGLSQAPGLWRRQHAEGHAGFESRRLDAFDHRADRLDIAVFQFAPSRAHAEALRAASLRRLRRLDDGVGGHQFPRLEPRVEMRRLAAIAAIFRTSAGLDRQQLRALDGVRFEMPPQRPLRVDDQVRERAGSNGQYFAPRPVVADVRRGGRGHAIGSFKRRR